MFKSAILFGAIAAAMVSSAHAQSWSFGVEVGPPIYGAPPSYYGAPAFERALPLSPDAVFDALEAAGYREFSPMAPRGDLYKLNAVNPRGDLVALEVSAFSGAIESEFVLAPRRRPPLGAASVRAAPPQAAPPPAPRGGAPAGRGHNDPLVVY